MGSLDGDRLEGEREPTSGDEQETEREPARLDLDEDERLPWLESAEDDDYEEGSDTGKLIAFLLAGLVILGALVGGIWWMSHRGDDSSLQADGSIIEAPASPYKEAPEDPGGKTFAGTGDTSYAVSEGQTRQPRLASGTPTPAATPAAKPVASQAAAPATAATEAPAGPGVQVGAYSSQASAQAGWSRLSQQNPELLSGVKHRIVEGRADIGTVYRLQALPGDAAAARALCDRLKSAGVACQVKN